MSSTIASRGADFSHRMETLETGVDLLQLAGLRHDTYQLLAGLLLYPDESTAVAASEAAQTLLRQNEWASALAFYPAWERCLSRLESLTAASLHQLQAEYNSLFSGGSLVQAVSLYESTYLEPTVAESGQVMADLEREYASLGLTISPDEGESPDHAALEMEFISFLCEHEIKAWEREDMPAVEEVISRQKRFLEGHPCKWFSYLAGAVTARDPNGLYALTAQAAHAVIVHDSDLMALLLQHLSGETAG